MLHFLMITKMIDYNKINEGYNNFTNQNDMLKIFEMIKNEFNIK